MAVLEILKTRTNSGRPISVARIVKQLNSEYDIATSRDSVKAILDDLMAYYPGPDQIRCKESEKGRPYCFDYYYQTRLPEYIQENIQTIELAIGRNKRQGSKESFLTFQFNGHGTDHQLHPTGKTMELYPVRILWAYGHPYLVGFFAGREDAAHIRIDLMSSIRSGGVPARSGALHPHHGGGGRRQTDRFRQQESWPFYGWYSPPVRYNAQSHYLRTLKNVASAFGYSPAHIDAMLDEGWTTDEIEEALYETGML